MSTHVGLTLEVPDLENPLSFPVDRTHVTGRCDTGFPAHARSARRPPRCAAQPPRGAGRPARPVPFQGPGWCFVTARATGSCPATDATERAASGPCRRYASPDGAPGRLRPGAFCAAGIGWAGPEERPDGSVIGPVLSCGTVESPGLRTQAQGRGIGACGAGAPVRLDLHRPKTRRNRRRRALCRHARAKVAGKGIRQ